MKKTNPLLRATLLVSLMSFSLPPLVASAYVAERHGHHQDQDPQGRQNGSSVKSTINDAAITTKVKLKFAGDSVVKALDVHVTTERGVVVLTGDVDTRKQIQRAEELARSVKGVRSVNVKGLKLRNSTDDDERDADSPIENDRY